jgi:hypothetical protein
MHYLISVIDDAQTIAADSNDSAAQNEVSAVDVFNDKLVAEGHLVYANGLAAPEAATVIDNRGEEPVVIDGPFLESKEFLGGLWIIEAPNLDVALKLAAEGSRSCNRKVELRPFHGDPA